MKTYKKHGDTRITIRFPDDIARDLRLWATRNDRSINGEVIHGLRQYLKWLKDQHAVTEFAPK